MHACQGRLLQGCSRLDLQLAAMAQHQKLPIRCPVCSLHSCSLTQRASPKPVHLQLATASEHQEARCLPLHTAPLPAPCKLPDIGAHFQLGKWLQLRGGGATRGGR